MTRRVVPTALLRCQAKGCSEQYARYYYLGFRCQYHAPSEEMIRAHAVRTARRNDRLRHDQH